VAGPTKIAQSVPEAVGNADCDPSDLYLLEQIAARSETAFLRFFQRWAPRLRRFLMRACGSRETAEDLLQEAFLRILQAAPRFRPEGPVSAWVYRICANLAYSHWRRQQTASAHHPGADFATEETGSAGTSGPESALLRRRFVREVEAAVGRLPPNQRLAFLLKVDQGLTYAEIAAILECPTGTAKSRFHHAVLQLRTELTMWEPE
jgi:RNA polymerase sigma-70 factor, ECF subfamily